MAHDYLHIKPQGRLGRGWPCQLLLSVMAGHIAGCKALTFGARSWKAPAEKISPRLRVMSTCSLRPKLSARGKVRCSSAFPRISAFCSSTDNILLSHRVSRRVRGGARRQKVPGCSACGTTSITSILELCLGLCQIPHVSTDFPIPWPFSTVLAQSKAVFPAWKPRGSPEASGTHSPGQEGREVEGRSLLQPSCWISVSPLSQMLCHELTYARLRGAG